MKLPSPHDLGLHKILNPLRPLISPIVDWPSKQRLRAAVNIADLRQCAKLRAHKMVFDYLDSGADDEIILRRAKDAYTELEMHYHVLAGLQPPLDLSSKVFGCDVKLPFFACPTAGNRMFHHEGESAAAAAAAHHGTLYGLSSLGTTSITDIAKMCARLWWQRVTAARTTGQGMDVHVRAFCTLSARCSEGTLTHAGSEGTIRVTQANPC